MNLRELAAIEHEVDVLEAERLVILAEAKSGRSIPNARRPLFPHEVRSGIRFGDIAETLAHAERLITSYVSAAKRELIDLLGEYLPTAGDRDSMLAAIAALNTNPPEPVSLVLDQLTESLHEVFETVRERGYGSLMGEADYQGIDILARPNSRMRRQTAKKSAAYAVATSLWLGVMQKLMEAATVQRSPAIGAAAIIKEVTKAPFKNIIDMGRQETHVQHNGGRYDALQELPPPEYMYSGELLDNATCDRCAAIDGYRFKDDDEALTYYPMGGPMVSCEGGNRCRGTLVIEFVADQPGDNDGVPRADEPSLPQL